MGWTLRKKDSRAVVLTEEGQVLALSRALPGFRCDEPEALRPASRGASRQRSLDLVLDRLGCIEDRLRLEEIETADAVDAGADQDVGRLALDHALHDRPRQDLAEPPTIASSGSGMRLSLTVAGALVSTAMTMRPGASSRS
jgi:hypothetical protein